MRLFSTILGVIAVNTYAQFRARITHLSRYESIECISKQAYYDVENSYIAVVSLDDKCDEVLTNAFKKAIIKPENLKIQVIKNPRDFEYILRMVQDFCSVAIIQESIKISVTWFFFDCTKNKERNKKFGITWIIAISLTVVGITICAAIGACCYLALRSTHPIQRRRKESAREDETSNRNVDELSRETNNIKSHSTSTKKTLPEMTHRKSSRRSTGSTSFSRIAINETDERKIEQTKFF
uniref:Uncharacterized protein n=1 Tax=Wuchereria bancrofti TaxID=6293 RepID=A0AAF5Q464_WUCBA